MAIAFDAASEELIFNVSSASVTVSHTISGTDRILVLGITTFDSTATNLVSGITYDGVAMTKLTEIAVQANARMSVWYLIAPNTGTNDIVATFAANQTYVWLAAASYTGVKQSGFPDASNSSATPTSSTISDSVTTVADNCWVVMCGYGGSAGITAGANTTLRAVSVGDTRQGICDNNAAKTPAGSVTLTLNCNNDNTAAVIFSLEPAPTSIEYTETLNETVTLVETSTKQTNKTVNETVTLVDTISKSLSKSLSEVITLVDTIDTSKIFTEILDEVLTMADTSEQKVTAKTLYEALALVDDARRDLDRTLNETLVLVETVGASKTYLREFSETLTIADTLAKQANKNLSELITLVDDASTIGQYARSLDETATLVDDVVNTAGKVLTDTLALVDTIAKVGVFARELDENISLVERFQGLLNGQNIAWFRKYTEQAGTFIKKYLDIP